MSVSSIKPGTDSITQLQLLLAMLRSCRRMARDLETGDRTSKAELQDSLVVTELNVLRMMEQ